MWHWMSEHQTDLYIAVGLAVIFAAVFAVIIGVIFELLNLGAKIRASQRRRENARAERSYDELKRRIVKQKANREIESSDTALHNRLFSVVLFVLALFAMAALLFAVGNSHAYEALRAENSSDGAFDKLAIMLCVFALAISLVGVSMTRIYTADEKTKMLATLDGEIAKMEETLQMLAQRNNENTSSTE